MGPVDRRRDKFEARAPRRWSFRWRGLFPSLLFPQCVSTRGLVVIIFIRNGEYFERWGYRGKSEGSEREVRGGLRPGSWTTITCLEHHFYLMIGSRGNIQPTLVILCRWSWVMVGTVMGGGDISEPCLRRSGLRLGYVTPSQLPGSM